MPLPKAIVAFSGHRSLVDPAAVQSVLRDQLAFLKEQAALRKRRLEFYGSIALGADTLAVEVCRELQIPVHLILPKPIMLLDDPRSEVDRRQGFAADFWSGNPNEGGTFQESDWARTFRQIKDAEAGVDEGSLELLPGSHDAPECYYETGLRTLKACHILLVVWNGEKARGPGGTGDMVDDARARKLPLIIIPTAEGATVQRENLDQLRAPDEPA